MHNTLSPVITLSAEQDRCCLQKPRAAKWSSTAWLLHNFLTVWQGKEGSHVLWRKDRWIEHQLVYMLYPQSLEDACSFLGNTEDETRKRTGLVEDWRMGSPKRALKLRLKIWCKRRNNLLKRLLRVLSVVKIKCYIKRKSYWFESLWNFFIQISTHIGNSHFLQLLVHYMWVVDPTSWACCLPPAHLHQAQVPCLAMHRACQRHSVPHVPCPWDEPCYPRVFWDETETPDYA